MVRKHEGEVAKLTIQLPTDLVVEVDLSAEADDRSRQAQIAVLLREALAARAKKRRRHDTTSP